MTKLLDSESVSPVVLLPFPPTSPTTLMGGFSLAVSGGSVVPTDVIREASAGGGGDARPSSSSSPSFAEGLTDE